MTSRAGQALIDLIRAALLQPEVAKLIGGDGKPKMVALVEPELIEREIAAIEQEVRDDIRARLEGPVRALHRWDCSRPASEFNEPLAEIVRVLALAAISSSSATETQDGERPRGEGRHVCGCDDHLYAPTPDDRDREVERCGDLPYDAHDWNSNGSPSFCRDCGIGFPKFAALRDDAGLRASGGTE